MNLRLALEHAHLSRIRRDLEQSVLHRFDLITLEDHRNGGILVFPLIARLCVSLERGAARDQFYPRAREPVIQHSQRAVLADAEKYAWREQHLGPATRRPQHAFFFDLI